MNVDCEMACVMVVRSIGERVVGDEVGEVETRSGER